MLLNLNHVINLYDGLFVNVNLILNCIANYAQ